MSVIRPEFLRVLPADINAYKYDGAALRALIRYATGLKGGKNGRRVIDGKVWWEATYDDIAEALGGVSRDSVGRSVRRLEADKGLLTDTLHTSGGDQTKAYRVPDDETGPDQQCAESNIASDQQCAESHIDSGQQCAESHDPRAESHDPRAESHDPGAESHATPCEIAHSSSLIKELKVEQVEGGERARERARARHRPRAHR